MCGSDKRQIGGLYPPSRHVNGPCCCYRDVCVCVCVCVPVLFVCFSLVHRSVCYLMLFNVISSVDVNRSVYASKAT